MLPCPVFEDLVQAARLRSEKTPSERRGAVRVPLRAVIQAQPILHGIAYAGPTVRVRDLSRTGVAVLSTCVKHLGSEFLLRFAPPTKSPSVIWCRTLRRTNHDKTCSITSATFLRLLGPGQSIPPRSPLSTLEWIDVAEEFQTAKELQPTAELKLAV